MQWLSNNSRVCLNLLGDYTGDATLRLSITYPALCCAAHWHKRLPGMFGGIVHILLCHIHLIMCPPLLDFRETSEIMKTKHDSLVLLQPVFPGPNRASLLKGARSILKTVHQHHLAEITALDEHCWKGFVPYHPGMHKNCSSKYRTRSWNEVQMVKDEIRTWANLKTSQPRATRLLFSLPGAGYSILSSTWLCVLMTDLLIT